VLGSTSSKSISGKSSSNRSTTISQAPIPSPTFISPAPTPSPTFLSPNPLSNITQQIHRATTGMYFTLLPL